MDNVRSFASTALRHLRAAASVVTPLGWTALVFSVACWLAGYTWGWKEAFVLAAAAAAAVRRCRGLHARPDRRRGGDRGEPVTSGRR
ncbi:MAG: hypothetical protein QM733_05435 [Ilumatobacteraceae bacterium]